MSSNITLRDAIINDAADLAILDNVASHGLSLWFWQYALMNSDCQDPLEWGRARMADEKSPFGFTNAVVALTDGMVVGAGVGYVMNDVDHDTFKSDAPVMKPLYELFAQCRGQWLLDSLGVYLEHRNKGIGGMLLDDGFRRARLAGVSHICLVVDDSNDVAMNLYKSRGFKELDRRKIVAFDDISENGNWVLLSALVN